MTVREAARLTAWTRVEDAVVGMSARGKLALGPDRGASRLAPADLAVRGAAIEGLAVGALLTARDGSPQPAVGIADARSAAAERNEGADRPDNSSINPHRAIVAQTDTLGLFCWRWYF